MSRPILAVRGLDVRAGDRLLVRGLELEIRAGECVAILGRNGAGKSLTLHALAGLGDPGANPPAGSLSLDGQPLEAGSYTVMQGERLGDHGAFFVEGPGTSLQVSACPIGELDVDPYAALPGEEPGTIEPVPPPEGETGEEPAPIPQRLGRSGCDERTVVLCDLRTCASFDTEDVDLEIVEEGAGRRLALDGANDLGAIRVELLYRERR